jgi:hypothetical protein
MLMTTRKIGIVAAGALTLVLSFARGASAQNVCDEKVKEEVAKLLADPLIVQSPGSKEALALEAKIAAKYSKCAADSVDISKVPPEDAGKFCGKLSHLGNTTYEQMRCCGYDPQKQLFACPVDILKPYGFGTATYPGSYENVLTCIDFGYGAGFQPVARDRVHLANSPYSPIWEFAVIASAKETMKQYPMDSKPYKARSILSWGFTPTKCDDTPYWGNSIDYEIRLDP